MNSVPVMTVKPSRALFDEKFHVVVGNLPPTQEVTLHSLHQSEDTDYWEAFGHYVSDAQGRVTVAKAPSVGGTYEGVEPMGLLWSMRPVPGSRTGLRLRKKELHTPMVVHISVYRGHMSQGFREQAALASVVTERWYMAPGVRRVDITEGGVTGTLFLPPGPGPFPGVLDMWGGGGGLVEYRAALLASHGFAAMAVMYLFPDHKKNATIGYPYFENAFRLLQDHPLVAADRSALLGISFGVPVVLSITAYSETVKPRCCVCISGTHTGRIGATQSIAEATNRIENRYKKACRDEKNRLIWRDVFLPIPEDIDLKVEMGRITCPLLLVVGQDDQNNAAVESADDMKQMMERAGNSHLLTTLSYPGAGHLIETPYGPHCKVSSFLMPKSNERVVMLWGGLTKPHAVAQEDSWEKILRFLREHLYHSVKPHVQSRL
ncbi:acyl-coenzyme A thioesterase 1 [Coregonus clupeaformis]|uniref:acyl-coenzyme A thioesterase 1 n=1 Tax=Coregonus clupeaformis TaxID=59861 RepID=UPI001BE11876|nr:acyl-coenzyme A thioesterase 1 [Coregonus clupeaformis]